MQPNTLPRPRRAKGGNSAQPAKAVYRIKLTAQNVAGDYITQYATRITCSRDAHEVFRQIFDVDTISIQESMWCLYLNRSNTVIGYSLISIGGVSGTVADPKLIFSSALQAMASSIILAHNHPSGSLTPSPADRDLTRKIRDCGKFLDIPLLDHHILSGTSDHYLSFADEGLL